MANQFVFRVSDGFRDRLVGISWTEGFRKYQLRSVSERTFFAGLNRNVGATINRSATTYGVRNSISDRLSVCPLNLSTHGFPGFVPLN